ncbi:unnamed protein product [Symbiodinium sp. CCMP2592]|nr:unnamed protein product [Symbiodinium sp. CCMP2592]
MGRFHTILHTQVIMDYLAVIVNIDTTRLVNIVTTYEVFDFSGYDICPETQVSCSACGADRAMRGNHEKQGQCAVALQSVNGASVKLP